MVSKDNKTERDGRQSYYNCIITNSMAGASPAVKDKVLTLDLFGRG